LQTVQLLRPDTLPVRVIFSAFAIPFPPDAFPR